MITIRLDCAIAENFDIYYIDQNGDKVLLTSFIEHLLDAMNTCLVD